MYYKLKCLHCDFTTVWTQNYSVLMNLHAEHMKENPKHLIEIKEREKITIRAEDVDGDTDADAT